MLSVTILVPDRVPGFSVAQCIRRLTQEDILPTGKLVLTFERRPIESPAYVKLPERILYADPEFWEECQDNLPDLRFILGHEIGHIFLHDHYAQPYSGLSSRAWLPEESAEWQADRFSDYFLVSDDEITRYVAPTPSLIIVLWNATSQFGDLDEISVIQGIAARNAATSPWSAMEPSPSAIPVGARLGDYGDRGITVTGDYGDSLLNPQFPSQ
jgi:hypothetical protein